MGLEYNGYLASWLFALAITLSMAHGLAPLALALVGGFHEREDLDRLVGTHGGLAGLEELDDLDDQGFVAP